MKWLERHYREFMGILLSAVLITLYLLMFGGAGSRIFDILKRNLIFDSPLLFLDIFAFTMIIGFLGYLFIRVIFAIHNQYSKPKRKPNWWIWGTILIMILVFSIGLAFIDNLIGNQELKLDLNERYPELYDVGTLNCTNNYYALLEGTTLHCVIEPNLINMTGNVTFFVTGGQRTIEDFSDLSFIAPSDVRYIYFEINGIDQNSTERNLSVGWSFHFPTKEEFEERRNLFLAYLVGLFAVVMFSIPAAFANFKSLSNK